jgi:heterodisulfide reductase subunit B
MPVLSLSHAEQDGFDRLIAPCLACQLRLKAANKEMQENPEVREKIHRAFDYHYRGTVRVYHPLEVMMEEGMMDGIRSRVRRRLSGLKVACYYGCVLTRPPEVAQFDVCENPQSMDTIIRALGGEPLEWSYKTECCGVSMTLTRTDIVLKLSSDILREAKEVGAHAIAVCCPLCQANLDTRQHQIEEEYRVHYGIPILYFTQLMGLAFGAFPRELGLEKLVVSPRDALEICGLM